MTEESDVDRFVYLVRKKDTVFRKKDTVFLSDEEYANGSRQILPLPTPEQQAEYDRLVARIEELEGQARINQQRDPGDETDAS